MIVTNQTDKDWDAIRDRFRSVVFRRGVDVMAAELPADRSTVYRLFSVTRKPTLAIRVRIAEILKKDKKP